MVPKNKTRNIFYKVKISYNTLYKVKISNMREVIVNVAEYLWTRRSI